MANFQKILFPVDLSESSEKIAPFVKELAAKLKADIYLLFVARRLQGYGLLYVPHPNIKQFEEDLTKGGIRKLKEFVEIVFEDRRPLSAEVVAGEPSEVIIEYAVSKGIDVIVMGTHGRKGLDRILFGSVAEHVVKNSPIPVLTVNPYKSEAA
ncbi:MAG: universal stress protein [Pseudomonadota bacterium]